MQEIEKDPIDTSVLIAEDDALIAADLRHSLSNLGYHAAGTASSESEVVRMVEAAQPDLILMDIRLADGVDGIELAGRLRSRFDIPIVYLVGYGEKNVLDRAKRTKPYGFLAKPVSEAELRWTLEIALYKHKADVQVRRSEERYRSLAEEVFDGSAVGMFILDAQFRVVWLNGAMERFFGLRREDAVGKDKRVLIRETIRFVFEDPDEFEAKVLPTYQDNTYVENFECRVKAADGREARWLEHLSRPVRTGLYAGGRIEQYYDVTDRKRTEARLRESEEKYRNLVELSPVGVLVHQEDRIAFANSALAQMLGVPSPDDLIGQETIEFVQPQLREKIRRRISALIETRKPAPILEQELIRLDGGTVTVEAAAAPIEFQGRPAFHAVIRDISDRNKAEALIKASLAEKDALLREIHHRVKNNLAVISSLLNLQLRYSAEGVDRDMFTDLQARIQSMALAHELLYQSESIARLSMSQYLTRLIDSLSDSLRVIGKSIRISKEIHDDLIFTLDEAIPVGFIVTELFSNALKHAFPDCAEGRITVSLQPTAHTQAMLIVSDNGVGMPADIEPATAPTLGLKLVSIFVRQLRAKMLITRDNGTEVRIMLDLQGSRLDTARPA